MNIQHRRILIMNDFNYDKIKKIIGCPQASDIKFVKKFQNQGKQGVAGIASIKNNTIAYKISQYINHIVLHEALIMNSLTEMRKFCPHFCKYYGLCSKNVNGNYRKLDNPFQITSKHPIQTDVLLMEYIEGKKLYNMIKNNKINDNVIFSAIKQLLFAISIAQTKKQFTHYDLHSCNVLMKECDPNTVHVYALDNENQFSVPTYGYCPVIIDFGFSYSGVLKGGPIYSSLAHTDVGFMTNQYDSISDVKLLLVSISEEIKRYRSSSTAIKFRNIVRNIFSCLDIDWECGWDNYDIPGAADHIVSEIENIKVKSNLFTKYPHYCVDLIQTLIHLPLEKLGKKNFDISYITMVNEFYKIEKELTSSIYHLYIFKKIVDSARSVKKQYHSDQRETAIKIFKKDVINTIMSVANFCCPKNIHYEKLLCSLYCFANASQRVLYDVIKTKNKLTQEKYSELELKTPEHIYGAIEINIPQTYNFSKNTNVTIFNIEKESRYTLSKLPDNLIKILNNTHPLLQGSILYEFYISQITDNTKTQMISNSKFDDSDHSDHSESDHSESDHSESDHSDSDHSDSDHSDHSDDSDHSDSDHSDHKFTHSSSYQSEYSDNSDYE